MENVYVSTVQLKDLIKFDLLGVQFFEQEGYNGVLKVKCLDTNDEFVNYFHDEIGINLNTFLKDFCSFLEKINQERGAKMQQQYFRSKMAEIICGDIDND